MPKIGEIVEGKKLGYKGGHRFIWTLCPVCKKERWVTLYKNTRKPSRCHICANTKENHPNWKGGRVKSSHGYILIWQSTGKYALEHRLIMAKHLGRPLESWEIVHHKNGIRDDNRIENLELHEISDHNIITILELENKRLRKKIKKLEEEIGNGGEKNK